MQKKLATTILACLVCLCAFSTASADIKLKTKMTVAGHTSEGTVYIKGKRERSSQNFGSGFEMVSITQCDLKQTVQVNDKARTYMVTPMQTESTPTASPAPDRKPAPERQTTTRRGGVVTYTTTITDTGERKKMFGFTARHIKTTMSVEATPDACNPTKMRMETDGWYIDLEFSFNCDLDRPPTTYSPASRSKPECQDEMRFRRSGAGKLGYPAFVTTTIYNDDGKTMSTTTEIVELETSTLEASLFEVPPGYTEAKNYQELMGMPNMDAMIRDARRGAESQPTTSMVPTGAKRAGTIRVGVVSIANKTDRSPSLESLRSRLIGSITESNVDAVPLDGRSTAEIDAEAKQKGCDYILYTDVTGLKASNKVGGLIGRATGVGGSQKVEARLDFRLFPVGSSSAQLTSSASAKEEGSEDASLSAAAAQEGKTVVTEVRRKH